MSDSSVIRRQLFKASATVPLSLSSGAQLAQAADAPPNGIFILADEGVRFTQAYANSAVYTATRVSLITGRYQYRLPVGLEEPLGIGYSCNQMADHFGNASAQPPANGRNAE